MICKAPFRHPHPHAQASGGNDGGDEFVVAAVSRQQ